MASADWVDVFGPEYTKINTVFERDDKGVVDVQHYSTPEIEFLANNPWVWHEKVDGTNIRLHWNGEVVTVGGREDNALLPARLVAYLGQSGYFAPDVWHSAVPDCKDVTVYGEGYGPGIRAGGNYGTRQKFIVFDVNIAGWWLSQENVADVARKLDFEVVPYIGEFTIPEMWDMVKLEDSSDPDKLVSAWPNCPIEGAVGRPATDLYTRKGERVIVKLKTRDYRDWRAKKQDDESAKA